MDAAEKEEHGEEEEVQSVMDGDDPEHATANKTCLL